MTESQTTFIVTASAEKHLRAERATIRLRISARSENSKADAYDAVSAVHNRLEREAREFRRGDDAPATWHHASAPTSAVYKEVDPKNDKRRVTVFTASSSIAVKFRDFEKLADWLAALADEQLVTSGAPEWTLTERTRKDNESAVRTQAVRNARQLATDYAAGDDIDGGLRLVTVDARVAAGQGYYAAAAAPRGAASGGHAVVAITPNEVTLRAEVTATYAVDEV